MPRPDSLWRISTLGCPEKDLPRCFGQAPTPRATCTWRDLECGPQSGSSQSILIDRAALKFSLARPRGSSVCDPHRAVQCAAVVAAPHPSHLEDPPTPSEPSLLERHMAGLPRVDFGWVVGLDQEHPLSSPTPAVIGNDLYFVGVWREAMVESKRLNCRAPGLHTQHLAQGVDARGEMAEPGSRAAVTIIGKHLGGWSRAGPQPPSVPSVPRPDHSS